MKGLDLAKQSFIIETHKKINVKEYYLEIEETGEDRRRTNERRGETCGRVARARDKQW